MKNVSRPVRLCTFAIYVIANDEVYHVNALSGDFVKKSDVHYCAEKDAIDMVNHYLEAMDMCEFTYLLYKVSKEKNADGQPKEVNLVSRIFADDETRQVVID